MYVEPWFYIHLFFLDFQVAEPLAQSTKNPSFPFNPVSYSPKNFLDSGNTMISIRNVTQSNYKAMDKFSLNQNLFEVTEKNWIPTTTHHFSTKEVR